MSDPLHFYPIPKHVGSTNHAHVISIVTSKICFNLYTKGSETMPKYLAEGNWQVIFIGILVVVANY